MPGLEELYVGTAGLMVLVYLSLPVFPFAYVMLRWRQGGGQSPAGLGTTAAIHYLRSLAVLVFLTGFSILLQEGVAEKSDEDMIRLAVGVLIGAVAFFVVNTVIGQRLEFRLDPTPVARVFSGFLMIVTGLVSFGALLAVSVLAVQEDTEGRNVAEATTWLVVWVGAFVWWARRLMNAPAAHVEEF